MATAGSIVFYYLAAACIASAILAVTRRDPVHGILWVLALFLHVAGIFLLAGAEFLAAVQLIVYAGAILVFYLFLLMLVDLPGEKAAPRFSAHWPLCVAASLVFAALALYAQDAAGLVPPAQRGSGGGLSPQNVATLGTALFGEFALPFEIVSVILLAAIVGAVVIAKKKTEA